MKKIILFIMCMFILINFTSAQSYWNSVTPWNYWSLNESAGNAVDDLGVVLLTNNGGSFEAGILGNAYNSDNNDLSNTIGNMIPIYSDKAISFNVWIKTADIGAVEGIFGSDESVGVGDYQLNIHQGCLRWDRSGADIVCYPACAVGCGTIVSTNTFHMVTITRNASNYWKLYINGSNVANATDSVNFTISDFYIGDDANFEGLIDELLHYGNYTLTDNDIIYLYNNGSGNTPYTIIPDAFPNVSLITPIDTFNTSNLVITFECNATDNNGIVNISLWIDTALNSTLENSTSGVTNLTLQENLTFVDGFYNWTCQATDDNNQLFWFPNNRSFNYTTFNGTIPPGLLSIDLSQDYNLVLFVLMVALAIFFFIIGVEILAGFLMTILGIILIVSEYSTIIGIFFIVIAIFILTLKRGKS